MITLSCSQRASLVASPLVPFLVLGQSVDATASRLRSPELIVFSLLCAFVFLLIDQTFASAAESHPRLHEWLEAQRQVSFFLSMSLVTGLGLHLLSGPYRLAGCLAFAPLLTALVFSVRQVISTTAQARDRGNLPSSQRAYGYVDRNDARLFVPKLIGVGWRMNLGHRHAPWIVAMILALAIGGVLFTR